MDRQHQRQWTRIKYKKLTGGFIDLLDRKDKRKKLKLGSDMGRKDRHVLKVKLKVVDAQIEKLTKTVTGE